MAAEHDRTMEKTAVYCTYCGHYNQRCPFGEKQIDRMKEITAFMEEL